MVRGISVLTLLVLLSTVAPAAPQDSEQEEPSATFFETVDIEVATVEVFVSDRKGTPVAGLDRDDFELLVDGRPVEITNFYAEMLGRPSTVEWLAETAEASEIDVGSGLKPPPQRLRIVVFIDHTNLRTGNRKRALDLLREFIGRYAGPDDGVAVVSLTDRLWIHSDFLNDPETIARIFHDVEGISYEDMSGESERRRILNEMSRGHTGGMQTSHRETRESIERGLDFPTPADFIGAGLEASIRAYAATEYQRTRASVEALKRFLGSLGGVPGRKALIYLSDGIINRPGEDLYVAYRNAFSGSTRAAGMVQSDPNTDYLRQVGQYDLSLDIRKVAAAANAAGVTVYAIDAEGDHTTAVRSAQLDGGAETNEIVSTIEANAREPLEYATEATGGRRIQASDRLLSDLTTVAADFDSYYSLGFRPPEAGQGATQNVEVRLRGIEAGARHVVRYRESRRSKDAGQRVGEAMLAAIFYNATVNPLELGLTQGEPVRREDGNLVLPVTVEIPVAKLALVPEEAVSAARLSIYVTVKDEKGDARAVQEMPFHLRIPADKVAEAMRHAAHHTLQVVLRPGDQQVAVGVRDEVAATLSTVRLEVGGTV